MNCKSEPETKWEKIFLDFLRLSALVFVGCRADKMVHEGACTCGGCDGCDESQMTFRIHQSVKSRLGKLPNRPLFISRQGLATEGPTFDVTAITNAVH